MDQDFNYRHVATLCHASSNVCPEVFISNEAPEERQVMILVASSISLENNLHYFKRPRFSAQVSRTFQP